MPIGTAEIVESLPADPEDFLSDSLQTLYDYQPISLTSPGEPFSYTWNQECVQNHEHNPECGKPITVSLRTPDTAAVNWALQAAAIWASSIYLADNLTELHLVHHINLAKSSENAAVCHVLELGASAGLPSILIAKVHPEIEVTATDYPDEYLMRTLSENVQRNGVALSCRVLPFAWGTDPTPILPEGQEKFDVIIATDVLWSPDSHQYLIDSFRATLKKCSASRIHLIVGLHTGRYTVGSFLRRVSKSGFDVESITERKLTESSHRDWDIDRENEDERERRKWVIWIQLKWTTTAR